VGFSLSQMVGPTLVILLCIQWGRVGWFVMGGLIVIASLLMVPASSWVLRSRALRGDDPLRLTSLLFARRSVYGHRDWAPMHPVSIPLFWLNLRIASGLSRSNNSFAHDAHQQLGQLVVDRESTGFRAGWLRYFSQSVPARCWSLETELDGVPNAAVADLLIDAV
jgi:hypothetical protein